MFEILAEVIKIILSNVSVLFIKGICRELRSLFDVMEGLLRQATTFYKLFEQYAESSEPARSDPDFRQRVRKELKLLLQCLMRYEMRLKEMSAKLSLLDEKDLSIRLVNVPESSYSMFKTHFVDDVAPKFVANTSGTQYILRRTKKRAGGNLVSLNDLGHISLDLERLFKEGRLSYETVDVNNKSEVDAFLDELQQGIKDLKSAKGSLRTLILKHCKIEDLF